MEFKDKLCDLVYTCMQTMNRPSLNRETSNLWCQIQILLCIVVKMVGSTTLKSESRLKCLDYYNSHEIRAMKSLNSELDYNGRYSWQLKICIRYDL